MGDLGWTGSDSTLLAAADIETLAGEVAAEITDEQYDGYKARNPVLAAVIAFNLCTLTNSEHWQVHAEQGVDEDGRLYRVWVER
ncbi:hypothetical protein [Alicyclobacillus sp. ALC3]|uniref:hypothetical protein n=1 Tax=Alicyclobacillus sp. ALC3 TaxID=2796143 RepID=UPI002379C052|nr:hypothetical protein [Alicyclobacillus sp. ALC3]WDL99761.1 hypothetical protein JC200_23600 [Alicyclobacillus sp. ALC3]